MVEIPWDGGPIDLTTTNPPNIHADRRSAFSLTVLDDFEAPVISVQFDEDFDPNPSSAWNHDAVNQGVPPCQTFPYFDGGYMTSKDAVAASSQPVMLSHSFLADDATQNPRLISADHALMVAETGGLIGAWPTGIGNPDFMSFIDRLLRLVDVVVVDHVSLGTDMDANYLPVFTNYRQMPYIPAVLKRRGMRDDEIIKVLGGNFMRVFDEVTRAGANS